MRCWSRLRGSNSGTPSLAGASALLTRQLLIERANKGECVVSLSLAVRSARTGHCDLPSYRSRRRGWTSLGDPHCHAEFVIDEQPRATRSPLPLASVSNQLRLLDPRFSLIPAKHPHTCGFVAPVL